MNLDGIKKYHIRLSGQHNLLIIIIIIINSYIALYIVTNYSERLLLSPETYTIQYNTYEHLVRSSHNGIRLRAFTKIQK